MRLGGDDRADPRAVSAGQGPGPDIVRRAGIRFDLDAVDPDAAGAALLVGFPDRLAARRRPGPVPAAQRPGAWVADDDPLATAPFVVAADLDGKRNRSRIRLGAAVDDQAVAALLEALSRPASSCGTPMPTTSSSGSNAGSTTCASTSSAVDHRPGAATTAAFVERLRPSNPPSRGGRVAPDQVRPRVGVPALNGPRARGPTCSIGPSSRRSTTGWRRSSPGAIGMTEFFIASTSPCSCGPVSRGRSAHKLDEPVLPLLGAAIGRDAPLDYHAERPPPAVRVQDPFGVDRAPDRRRRAGAADARPAVPRRPPDPGYRRPPGFWTASWAALRKDLAGRYPKDRWPDDPATADPGRLNCR